jgi:8-oxo-dGTP diphosphatase
LRRSDKPAKHSWSVSVAGIVIREDGRILAIKRRDNGHWEPPGGVLEPGEPMQQGLVREVQEETSVVVEPGDLSGVYQNLELYVVALVFRCHIRSGAAQASAEASEVAWLSPKEVTARMTPAFAVRITDALGHAKTTVRVHDGVKLP